VKWLCHQSLVWAAPSEWQDRGKYHVQGNKIVRFEWDGSGRYLCGYISRYLPACLSGVDSPINDVKDKEDDKDEDESCFAIRVKPPVALAAQAQSPTPPPPSPCIALQMIPENKTVGEVSGELAPWMGGSGNGLPTPPPLLPPSRSHAPRPVWSTRHALRGNEKTGAGIR
jgi:hypothetical protein